MRAGPLRHRVTLWARTEAQAASGAVTWTWAEVCTLWGDVTYERGSKGFAAQQLYGTQPVRVRLRDRTGVRTDQRLTWAPECSTTQFLEILSVIPPTGRALGTELHCLLREADGWRTEK